MEPKQYQIFWKDNDQPVGDYEVVDSDAKLSGFLRLMCSDGIRLINRDEVSMIVIKDPS